jgi:hypothetical protein
MRTPTQRQLANALGVDPALVTRYKRRGMPVDSIEAAQAWKLDNVQARVSASQDKTSEPSPGGERPAGAAAGESYSDHRARREKAEADMAELTAMRMAQTLMPVEPAERAVFEAFRVLRDSTAAALRTAATMVLGLTDVREIEAVLEEAQRSAYSDFEARMKQRMRELAKP